MVATMASSAMRMGTAALASVPVDGPATVLTILLRPFPVIGISGQLKAQQLNEVV